LDFGHDRGMERIVPAEVIAERLEASPITLATGAAEAVRTDGSPLTLVRTERADLLLVYRRRLARRQRGEGPRTEGLEDFVASLAQRGEVWLATARGAGWAFVIVLGDGLNVEAVTGVEAR
jgi:hypothetical protein